MRSRVDEPIFLLTVRPYEDIDEVFSPRVNDRRNIMPVNDVEPRTKKWEPLLREIGYWWNEVQLAVKPGLYRVLIGRQYIRQVSGLQ